MTEFTVPSLNLCWSANAKIRDRQLDVLATGDFDVVLLQEVRLSDLARMRPHFEWASHTLAVRSSGPYVGVMAPEAADCGPVPEPFVAATLNV